MSRKVLIAQDLHTKNYHLQNSKCLTYEGVEVDEDVALSFGRTLCLRCKAVEAQQAHLAALNAKLEADFGVPIVLERIAALLGPEHEVRIYHKDPHGKQARMIWTSADIPVEDVTPFDDFDSNI